MPYDFEADDGVPQSDEYTREHSRERRNPVQPLCMTGNDIGQLIPSASRDQANQVKLSTPITFYCFYL